MDSKQIVFQKKHQYIIAETIYESNINNTAFYKAKDCEYDRIVGIKTIDYKDIGHRKRLLQEAKCMTKLDDVDGIPKLYEYYVDDKNKTLILVMQYIEGVALTSVIEEEGAKRKDLYIINKNIELFYHLSLIVGEIHKSRYPFQHKDLKPDNIIIKNKGLQNQHVYVIDLGITGLPMVKYMGTEFYQAPEQLGYLDYALSDNIDVFALGLILFELMTGKKLKIGVDLKKRENNQWETIPLITDYNECVPAIYNNVLARCLQLLPNKRYKDGMQLANDLKSELNKRRRRR